MRERAGRRLPLVVRVRQARLASSNFTAPVGTVQEGPCDLALLVVVHVASCRFQARKRHSASGIPATVRRESALRGCPRQRARRGSRGDGGGTLGRCGSAPMHRGEPRIRSCGGSALSGHGGSALHNERERGACAGVQLRRGAAEVGVLLRGAAIRSAAGEQARAVARRLGASGWCQFRRRSHGWLVRRGRSREVRVPDGRLGHDAGVGARGVPTGVCIGGTAGVCARQPAVGD